MKRITAILITVILSGVFLASLVFAGVGAPPYNPANVKITGGTINGASVGVTTPGAGAFSTLTANSNPTVGQTNSIARLSVKSIAVNGGAGQSEIYLSSSTTHDRAYLSYSHLLETLRVGVVGTTVGNFTSTGLNATQIGATT